MTPEEKEQLKTHLKGAINAFETGTSLFNGDDYSQIPEGKEDEIMGYCKKCSENMNTAMALDKGYTKVYQQFSDGGNDSDCRIAKNRWCFAKIDFVKARLQDLEST